MTGVKMSIITRMLAPNIPMVDPLILRTRKRIFGHPERGPF